MQGIVVPNLVRQEFAAQVVRSEMRGGGSEVLECPVSEDEYVCNGGFEMPFLDNGPGNGGNSHLRCNNNFPGWDVGNQRTPWWCSYAGTPDIAAYDLPPPPQNFTSLPYDCQAYGCSTIVNSPDGSNRISRNWRRITPGNEPIDNIGEALITELKDPLVPGEYYKLSFDVLSVAGQFGQGITIIPSVAFGLNEILVPDHQQYFPLTAEQIILDQSIQSDEWLHIEQVFSPDADHIALVFWGDIDVLGGMDFYFDNISIKSIPDSELVDLSINKTAELSGNFSQDQQAVYTIEVSNLGLNEATNIIVSDIVPSGLSYQNIFPSNQDVTYDFITGNILIPSIPSGGSVSINMRYLVSYSACGRKTNTAKIINLDQSDTDSNNNYDSADIDLRPCRVQKEIPSLRI